MNHLHDIISLPIGFIDSGLGGLSVLREALKIMPSEDFIYYGDSLHAPYGTKTTKTIRQLAFASTEVLLRQKIKALVVACNTATAAAIKQLRAAYPDLPIIGIEPAIRPAVMCGNGGRILVMTTPMTIRQKKFCKLLNTYQKQAEIIPVPCGGLMEFVEEGILDGKTLTDYFEKHLAPFITEDTETIVLGCTHYPFLKPSLKEFLVDRPIKLIDGSLGTSLELKRQLSERDLLRTENRRGEVIIQNSMDSREILDLSWKLLRIPIE